MWFATDDVAAQYCKPGGRDQLYVPDEFDDVEFTEAGAIAEHSDQFKEQGVMEGGETTFLLGGIGNSDTTPSKSQERSSPFFQSRGL